MVVALQLRNLAAWRMNNGCLACALSATAFCHVRCCSSGRLVRSLDALVAAYSWEADAGRNCLRRCMLTSAKVEQRHLYLAPLGSVSHHKL